MSKKLVPGATDVLPGRVWATDVDRDGYMNEYRYLRKAKIAQRVYQQRSGLQPWLQLQGLELRAVVDTLSVVRRLACLTAVDVRTKLVHVDDELSLFIFEHRFDMPDENSRGISPTAAVGASNPPFDPGDGSRNGCAHRSCYRVFTLWTPQGAPPRSRAHQRRWCPLRS